MNYSEINGALLQGRDIDSSLVNKDESFYTYLLNNKVAFYYASCVSKNSTATELAIITRGKKYQDKYEKSLKVIQKVCDDNGFKYLLYKTHKYIPEMVDGDIDLMVSTDDFWPFMKAFKKLGFVVEEDEPGKGKCEKDGYCVIEPHTNISWRGGGQLNSNFIWQNQRHVAVAGLNVSTVSYEVEVVAIIAKMLYEPAYLDIYSLKSLDYFYKDAIDEELIFKNAPHGDLLKPILKFCKTVQRKKEHSNNMPIFLPNLMYLRLWTRNLHRVKNWKIYLLHITFFFYWKYRYLITKKLPFTHHHDWWGNVQK